MTGPFEAVRISDHVYWVGAVDWGIRSFHGYSTPRGTSYNAYLVLADKITLIDTVKAPFRSELMARIVSVVEPAQISYVVSNHAEMDHSGCLPDVIEAISPERVFASTMGAKALREHFRLGQEVVSVADGETLSLGDMSLTFIETRMLHWPDSMFSYLAEDKLLFCQDAFGMHLASSERFADEVDDCILREEAGKYYANILLPYSSLVTKLIGTVAASGLELGILAPDHGPIWRKDPGRIIEQYGKWAAQEPTTKAVVAYDTMWRSTDLMARAICDGLVSGGATAELLCLSSSDRSEVAAHVLGAGALLVGSPTINNGVFPTVADLLCYLKGLRPANLIGAAFGSYGWSGEAVGVTNGGLREMGIDLVSEGIRAKYVPDDQALQECRALGALVAGRLKGS